MGLILNPNGYRVGHFRSWSDAWYMHRLYYPVFLHNVFLIKTLLHYLLYRFFPKKRSKWVYSHSNLYIYKNKIFISTYIYFNLYWKDYFRSYFNTFLKHKQFISLRMRSFWLKKTLLDRRKYAIRWFLLLYTMEIYIDYLSLENLATSYNKRFHNKLKNLRKKYSTPNKEFLAIEEIDILLKILRHMSRFSDRFGSTFLLNYFNKKFKGSSRFLRFKKSRIFWYEEKKKVETYKWIRYNIVFLLYIMSFTTFMLKQTNVDFSNRVMTKRLFEYKDCSNIIKKYLVWFSFRPIFFIFKKYIELFILKFGFLVTVNLFWINNVAINAAFVARYISGAIKLKFQFKDMMIPLRKLLGRLVFMRIKKRLNIFNFFNKNRKKQGNIYKHNIKYIYSFIYKLYYILYIIKVTDIYYKYISIKKRNKKHKFLNFFNVNNLINIDLDNYIKTLKLKYNFIYFILKNYKIGIFKLEKIKLTNYYYLKFFFYFNKKGFLNFNKLKIMYFFFLFKMIKNLYLLLKFDFNNLVNFLNKLNKLFFIKNQKLLLYLNINNSFFFFKKKKNYLFEKNIYILYNYCISIYIFKKLEEKFIQFDLFFYISKFFIRIYKNIKFYRRVAFSLEAFKRRYKLNNYVSLKKIYKNKKMNWFYYLDEVNIGKFMLNENIIFNNNFFYFYFKLKKKKLFHLKFWKRWRKKKLKLKDKKKFISWLKFLRFKNKDDLNILYKNFNYIKLKNNLKILKYYEKKGLKNLKFKKKRIINNLKFLNYKGIILKSKINIKDEIEKEKKRKQKQMWWDKKKLKQNLRKQYFWKIDVYLMNYMYYKSLRQFYDFKNFYNFYPFFYKIQEFFDYINKLYKFDIYYERDKYQLLNKNNYFETQFYSPSPLKKRKTKNDILRSHIQVLRGFKFEFRGRFTRKQKSANVWYMRGGNPLSTMDQNVEIGLHTLNLKYSKCSIKVWLYKGKSLPTFYVRFN